MLAVTFPAKHIYSFDIFLVDDEDKDDIIFLVIRISRR